MNAQDAQVGDRVQVSLTGVVTGGNGAELEIRDGASRAAYVPVFYSGLRLEKQPGSQERHDDDDRHAALVRELRAMADWLEAHPRLNLDWVRARVSAPVNSVDEVRAAADVMGVQAVTGPGDPAKTHWRAKLEFGTAELNIYAIVDDEQPGGES